MKDIENKVKKLEKRVRNLELMANYLEPMVDEYYDYKKNKEEDNIAYA